MLTQMYINRSETDYTLIGWEGSVDEIALQNSFVNCEGILYFLMYSFQKCNQLRGHQKFFFLLNKHFSDQKNFHF